MSAVRKISRENIISAVPARLFHAPCLSYATGYIDFDEELISSMLTDTFEGLKTRFGRE